MKNLKVESKIKGKTILITGGTGSFGSSVIKRLLPLKPQKIIVFSRDEKKQFDMRNYFDSQLLSFIVGDVRDVDSIEKAMVGIDYIFHAAALKQVPTCEFFPLEAIKTNILGASNIMDVALKYKVKRVVILSTDKAVYPINAMGMTKALMEKIMVAHARKIKDNQNQTTVFCGVRYGNVLYSRGSVVPFFINQIKNGQQVTVTNKDMTRFLMPLDEAIDLVLYALANGKNGDMYIRKASAATIDILAQAVCKIFDYDKKYKEVGIRSGEKMHETLISLEEMQRAIDEKKYFRIVPESQGLDYNKYYFRGEKISPSKMESFNSENTQILNLDQTIKLLLSIPEVNEELKNYKNGKK